MSDPYVTQSQLSAALNQQNAVLTAQIDAKIAANNTEIDNKFTQEIVANNEAIMSQTANIIQASSNQSIPISRIKDNQKLARRDADNVYTGYNEFLGGTNIGGGSSETFYEFLLKGVRTRGVGFTPETNVNMSDNWTPFEGFVRIPESGHYAFTCLNISYTQSGEPNVNRFNYLNVIKNNVSEYIDFPQQASITFEESLNVGASFLLSMQPGTTFPSAVGGGYGVNQISEYFEEGTYIYFIVAGNMISARYITTDSTPTVNFDNILVYFKMKRLNFPS